MGANEEIVIRPVKTCLNCGGAMRPSHGELRYQRGNLVVLVEDVPVSVCDACGERYVPGPIGVEIGDAVEECLRFFEARATKSDAVAQPRSLVMQASRQASLLFGT